jgi:hypothetical protein
LGGDYAVIWDAILLGCLGRLSGRVQASDRIYRGSRDQQQKSGVEIMWPFISHEGCSSEEAQQQVVVFVILATVGMLLTLFLSGCVNRNAMDDNKCKSYGAQRGTPAYTQCRMQLEAEFQRGNDALIAAGAGMMTQQPTLPPPPAPGSLIMQPQRPVNCWNLGSYVRCN